MPKLLEVIGRRRAARENEKLITDIQRLRVTAGDIILVRVPRDLDPEACNRARTLITGAVMSIGLKDISVLFSRDDVQMSVTDDENW